MSQKRLDRRQFLRAAAIVGVSGGIAGCTTDDGDDPTPTESVQTPNTPEPSHDDVTADVQTSESKDLTHLYGINGFTYPDDSVTGSHDRRFEWESKLGSWWMEMEFPRSLGRYYKELFGRSDNYDRYATNAYGDHHVSDLADELQRIGEENGLNDRQIVDLTIDFVQNLEYTEDEVTAGYDQYTSYPVETLIDRGGDCEDSTILLAALLRDMGYGVLLIGLFDAEPAHMALGVKGEDTISGTYYEYGGDRYYYVESTGEGWDVGEMPEMGGSTSAELMEIVPHPTLVYEYQTNAPDSGNGIGVEVGVGNASDIESSDTVLEVGFVDRDERTYGYNEFQFGSLGAEEETSKEVVVNPPDDVELKLKTRLYEQETLYDINESDWRYP